MDSESLFENCKQFYKHYDDAFEITRNCVRNENTFIPLVFVIFFTLDSHPFDDIFGTSPLRACVCRRRVTSEIFPAEFYTDYCSKLGIYSIIFKKITSQSPRPIYFFNTFLFIPVRNHPLNKKKSLRVTRQSVCVRTTKPNALVS